MKNTDAELLEMFEWNTVPTFNDDNTICFFETATRSLKHFFFWTTRIIWGIMLQKQESVTLWIFF